MSTAFDEFEYSFGLEEEFFVCSAESGDLAGDAARRLLEEARTRLGCHATCEMLQPQIETISPVFTHTHEAVEIMPSLRRALIDLARPYGLTLIAAGTHPFGVWQDQRVSSHRRYEQLLADFRIVGQRNLVCGLHVHVAVPPGIDRVALMNRAMPWLPLFLSLSTSSPFWNGHVTGLLSYRQALYDEWPRSGIPDFFRDEADYRAFASRMQQAGALSDTGQLWWAIRPAARFPTLELRIADSCTYVEHSVAIACLFRCLLAALVRRFDVGSWRSTHTRRIIDENRWRAKRDGIAAQFITEDSSGVAPANAQLEHLLALVAPEIDRFECAQAIAPVTQIMQTGTSAHEQLSIYNQGRAAGVAAQEALAHVQRWLARSTSPA